MTITFNPHLLFINWGHHRTYTFESPEGRLVYNELAQTLQELKSSGLYRTRFIFKTTNPPCIHPFYDNKKNVLTCTLQQPDDPYDPQLVSNKLIQHQHLERFDIHYYITLLYRALPSFRDPRSGKRNISPSTPIQQTYPLYWDNIHPHCWVMTELNRFLIATYFTSSQFDGVRLKKII